MKVYIVTDLEGVSGIVEFEDRKDESPGNLALRQKYSRLLAGEVNAAIDGAFAAGVSEILVNDCHGGCYTIDFEMLASRVRVIHGRERPNWSVGLDDTFAAMFSIGAHAMAGTRGGVLYHTMSSKTVREIRLNGKRIGEIGLEAFCAGAYGVPLIFVTGDAAACSEAEAIIPNITTVAVKEGLSRYSAISYPPAKAQEMIREGAKKAIKQIKHVRLYTLPPPYTYQVDAFSDKGDPYVSNPADLPDMGTRGKEIHAQTSRELIEKVWGRNV